jgi:hypothetical protein
MRFGAANNAGNSATSLESTAAGPATLEVTNAGQGNALAGRVAGPGHGVVGQNDSADPRRAGNGVVGTSAHRTGVQGNSTDLEGVAGISTNGSGVFGTSGNGHGVAGSTFRREASGVVGSNFASPVEGSLPAHHGVTGYSFAGHGVVGQSFSPEGAGVFGSSLLPDRGWAGLFDGAVSVTDDLSIGGRLAVHGDATFFGTIRPPFGFGDTDFSGSVTIQDRLTVSILVSPLKLFQIDHPLDPANKYLHHFSVESDEPKTFYDGIAVLNGDGEAIVELPEWFEALNGELRYQLTPLGAPAPDLHVAARVANRRFKIGGGREGLEVCWQVTGVRRDKAAQHGRLAVEAEKPAEERGRYLQPTQHGAPDERSIARARVEERRRRAAQQAPARESRDKLVEDHRRQKTAQKQRLEEHKRLSQDRQASRHS